MIDQSREQIIQAVLFSVRFVIDLLRSLDMDDDSTGPVVTITVINSRSLKGWHHYLMSQRQD